MCITSPLGVHLVGSVNLPTTTHVFNQIPGLLPDRLRRLPDGEPGIRDFFVVWQLEVFSALSSNLIGFTPLDNNPALSLSPSELAAAVEKLGDLQTNYDTAALKSYALFAEEKKAGVIPPTTRFQVCLPGIASVIGVVGARTPSIQPYIEPLYEAALLRSLEAIQSQIPHSELSIQIDAAVEFAFLENCGPWYTYFDPVFPGVIDRLSRFANHVAEDVELGFHLCYGDVGHMHFVEPKDLSLIVEVANALCKEVTREIKWIHVPVPKSRKDEEYLAPLGDLVWQGRSCILGLCTRMMRLGRGEDRDGEEGFGCEEVWHRY